jgi:hypothetical protein
MNPYVYIIEKANCAGRAKKRSISIHKEALWQHYDGVPPIQRPTEDAAFDNIARQARILSIVGVPDFDDDEWRVYLKDVELRYRNQNSNFVLPSDIAKELIHYSAIRVNNILEQIDMVMELRERLSLPILPAIPFKFAREYYRIEKLRKIA